MFNGRGVGFRQGLEFLSEVFTEDLDAAFIHLVEPSALLHSVLGIRAQYV